jgi:hypothetical protein
MQTAAQWKFRLGRGAEDDITGLAAWPFGLLPKVWAVGLSLFPTASFPE